MWVPEEPEEDARSLEPEIQAVVIQLTWVRPLEEQLVLSTAEPSLLSMLFFLLVCFETVSCCVALAGLEFATYADSQKSAFFVSWDQSYCI